MTGDRRPPAPEGGEAVPPGPRGLPVVGPLLEMRRDVLGTLHRALLRFGDVVCFAGGPPGRHRIRIYAIYHPDDVQRMRTIGDDVYSKQDPSSVELRTSLGDGLLTSVGPVWERQRRIVQPLFGREQVASFFPIVAEEADRLAEAWRGRAERGESVDLHRDSTDVSRRVISRVLFGADADRLREVVAANLPYLSRRTFRRSVAPIRIPSAWPTPGNRRAVRARQAISDEVDDVIARRHRQPADDLVSHLLHAPDPQGGPGLDDGEVRDQVFPFLLAGSDQPATQIAFALDLIGRHPEAQRAVQVEVDAVLGGRPMTVADVDRLTATAAAIKESMRLYPSAYALPRSVEKDEDYRGYRIPAGAQAVCAPWATHRHPEFWEDPERFDPDRFSPEAERERHPYAYFAFGGGPHGCVGAHLAMLEMVVVTATVLRRYRIEIEGPTVALETGINIRPGAAMPARISVRPLTVPTFPA